jgi:hypothetical protein
MINGVFGTLVTDGTDRIVFKNEYPVIQQYYNPIRKLDRLNVEVLKETGAAVSFSTGETCLIFRFVCKNKNLPY